jgi:hypothetical protein
MGEGEECAGWEERDGVEKEFRGEGLEGRHFRWESRNVSRLEISEIVKSLLEKYIVHRTKRNELNSRYNASKGGRTRDAQ